MSTPERAAPPFDPSEKIYDDEFAEPADRLESYADFAAIVKQLRRDCPWDREQTHESVKHLLIEEAYEVVDAIDSGDPEELKKELGDVFLHVLFHSRISEEDGGFTIKDVIEAETEKLVRRHPHVFGDAAAGNADEVISTWEQIKQEERAERRRCADVCVGWGPAPPAGSVAGSPYAGKSSRRRV